MRNALLALLALASTSCTLVESGKDRPPVDWSNSDSAVQTRAFIADLLTGSFSSAAQAARDPENYFDIRLEVAPVWTERADGPWLYVEQAAASSLDRPYRQRVYRIVGGPSQGFRSVMHELPGDPLSFAGAFAEDEPLASIAPEDLLPMEGCTVHLALQADFTVKGSTEDDACVTQWGDAVYATSHVTLTQNWMESWDRGYDAGGTQVWGATEGPYRFDRVD